MESRLIILKLYVRPGRGLQPNNHCTFTAYIEKTVNALISFNVRKEKETIIVLINYSYVQQTVFHCRCL